MKYRVNKESPLFKQLLDMKKESDDADEKCSKLTKRLGFVDYYKHPDFLGGGLIGFSSNKKKPGYYNPDKNLRTMWFPLAANNVLVREIAELPRVPAAKLNQIVGFRKQEVPGMPTIPFPKVVFSDDYCLIAVPEWYDYQPVPGMEEILTSMYKSLLVSISGYN